MHSWEYASRVTESARCGIPRVHQRRMVAGASREARARQIEAAPPEMRGTRLAEEGPAEPFQDAVRVRQDAPAALRRVGVVRRMLPVRGEVHRVRHLLRHGPDLRVEAERRQQAEVVFVEVRDGSRGEGNALRYAVAGPRHELVIQEIEFQLDVALGIGHRRGAEPARRDVERHLPPVILHRRQGEARLAHDLRPAMQRRLSVRPIAQRQVGPGCHARSAFPASHASMRCSRKCRSMALRARASAAAKCPRAVSPSPRRSSRSPSAAW